MEYLVFAVILYFILQTAGNLVFVLRGGGEVRSGSSASADPSHDWEGPSPRKHMEGISDRPTFWGEDVDDATWRDL
ncbi:MAG: hypothetical protein ABEL97_02100 [Salinibacter sp.]